LRSAPGAAPPVWQVVGLEGALLTLSAQSPEWSTTDTHGFSAAMAAHTNVSGTTLAPTLYGRWLAASAALSTAATAAPRWFHQLNGDPRARVAAGLGTGSCRPSSRSCSPLHGHRSMASDRSISVCVFHS